MSALAIVTYNVDQKYGTRYNENFKKFLAYMQKNDFTGNAGVTDVKGDRSKDASGQEDKDLYLRVVERRPDGIVVRGPRRTRRVPCPPMKSSSCPPEP